MPTHPCILRVSCIQCEPHGECETLAKSHLLYTVHIGLSSIIGDHASSLRHYPQRLWSLLEAECATCEVLAGCAEVHHSSKAALGQVGPACAGARLGCQCTPCLCSTAGYVCRRFPSSVTPLQVKHSNNMMCCLKRGMLVMVV